VIPKERLLVYLVVGCLVVVGATGWWAFGRVAAGRRERLGAERVLGEMRLKQARQAVNREVVEVFGEADHFFVDRELETLELLGDERRELERLLEEEPGLPSKEVLGRLERLRANGVMFAEEKVVRKGGVMEVEERLVRAVEVDMDDVKAVLDRVEGVGQGRPQMIVTEFGLRRKGEVFEMEMRFLKREFEE
jgi:hypothetical protein